MLKKVTALILVVLILLLVPTVLAGGWAVIDLDDLPGEIHAGREVKIGFTVLQHGQRPVHELGPGVLIQPVAVAHNTITGERIQAMAKPIGKAGHFEVAIVFPSDGEWEWSINPEPLAGDTAFEPLQVRPPLPGISPAGVARWLGFESGIDLPAGWWVVGLAIAVGVALLLIIRLAGKKQASEVRTDS
jgi:hypothetical protein